MARYHIYISAKLDPISFGALLRLADAWEDYNRDGRPNISSVVRKALVYSYLVLVEGVDPVRASADIERYIEEKLVELGLEAENRAGKKTGASNR